ncbi:unnamed protein product [Phytophthora lilii]|uniref:Unnamed protein product n=1 Tax=Phytophthora lilii TaxID=2077276 RepID=A0A9W6XIM7_9STRA|nr:unnamed protein product [Phytophthora lilii]
MVLFLQVGRTRPEDYFINHGLSDKNKFEPTLEDVETMNTRVHVVVVVPTDEVTINFAWKEPKPLVGTTGAKWDFQNSLDLDSLAPAINRHYQAWREEKTDKQTHPLFLCVMALGLVSRDC